jgi:hypothetical protein
MLVISLTINLVHYFGQWSQFNDYDPFIGENESFSGDSVLDDDTMLDRLSEECESLLCAMFAKDPGERPGARNSLKPKC